MFEYAVILLLEEVSALKHSRVPNRKKLISQLEGAISILKNYKEE
jgi:hypothetical protein